MLRVIRDVKPTWVVGENVLGLVNWNDGLVFNEVQADLEAEGYEVQAFVLPAASVNAPHKRDRVWFIAYSSRFRWRRRNEQSESDRNKERKMDQNIQQHRNGIWSETQRCSETSSNTDSARWQKLNASTKSDKQNVFNRITLHANSSIEQRKYIGQTKERKLNRSNSRNEYNNFQNFPTQSPICGGNDGFPNELDGITFSKWRNESIKAYGNAIVPQVAYQIFKAINEYNDL
jgi:DNA (cytosine-5)-methyltransferase 1